MLFDNAKLQPGETILVQAGGSGIGTAAIKMAKAIGCTVITTVGDDDKAQKAKALGADHVINYRTERFETITRKLTDKKGVDVVFEHVGGEDLQRLAAGAQARRTAGHLRLDRRARPITFNLMQLFQQQYNIFGSFGASMRNIRDSLAKMADGLLAGDRHRDRRSPISSAASRGWKAARCSARSSSRSRPQLGDGSAQIEDADRRCGALGDAALGFLAVHALRAIRLFDPDTSWRTSAARLMRDVGPVAAGASHRPRQSRRRISGKIAGRDREDPARRLGQSRPRRRRVRPYRPAVGLRPRRTAAAASSIPTRASRSRSRLRDDGKPALIFAAHLANWELPAVGAAAYGIDTTVLYRRPNMPAVADAVIAMRAGCMGTLVPTSLRRADQARRRAAARLARRACWSISTRCRAST